MGEFSIWHWLIVLAIVVMVFGTKKLKNIGSDLGEAVKGFKQGMKSAEDDAPQQPGTPSADAAARIASADKPVADPRPAADSSVQDVEFKSR